MSGRAAALLAATALLAGASPASAEEAAGDFQWRKVQLHGRLLVRGFTTRLEGASSSDAEAENARLELRWRPSAWLHAVLEYDQAEDSHLKDAYLSLRHRGYQLRAGNFKPPIAPVEMAARWELPASERGLLSDVLTYSFGVAGRRPGLQAGWNPKGGGWSAAAGVFRGSSVRGDRIGDEAFDNLAKDAGALKATARLAWHRKRLDVGGGFDLRPAEPLPGEGYHHYWTATADVALSAPKRGGPRAWAEGYLGSSWQDADPFDGSDATFLAGRVLGGWRFGGRKGRALYAEPYASATVFDPDTRVRDDVLWEAAGGVHTGGFEHLRLVLELQYRSVARNAPLALGLFSSTGVPPGKARTRLVAQLGAAF